MPPQPFTTECKPKRNSDSSFRSVADEGGLVVLPGRAEVKVLNPVGILVFELLDGEHTIGEIVRAVTEQFDVNEEQALADVRAFLESLAEHGMLAPTEEATA